jgi:uncharacterized membrane protein
MCPVTFVEVIDTLAECLEGAGVAVIVLGVVVAAVRAVRRFSVKDPGAYQALRVEIGRSILLGLELLVAGDIARTVAVAPTMENVLILAVIVVVRTFLSWSLELELQGRWPWQKKD